MRASERHSIAEGQVRESWELAIASRDLIEASRLLVSQTKQQLRRSELRRRVMKGARLVVLNEEPESPVIAGDREMRQHEQA